MIHIPQIHKTHKIDQRTKSSASLAQLKQFLVSILFTSSNACIVVFQHCVALRL